MVGAGHRILVHPDPGRNSGRRSRPPRLDSAVTIIPGPAAPAGRENRGERATPLAASSSRNLAPAARVCSGWQPRQPHGRIQLKGAREMRGKSRPDPPLPAGPPAHRCGSRSGMGRSPPTPPPSATAHGPPPGYHGRTSPPPPCGGEPAQPVMPLPSWVRKALSERLNSAAMACSSASGCAPPAPPRRGCPEG